MLYWKNNRFNAEEIKASVNIKREEEVLINERYKEMNEEPMVEVREVERTITSYIHDKEWYEEIQQRVFGVSKDEIIYEDFSLSEEQLERLKEINEFSKLREEMIVEVIDYVIENKFQEGSNHLLREFQLEKENVQLREELINLTIELKSRR